MNEWSGTQKGTSPDPWLLITPSLTCPQWREWGREDSGGQVHHGLHLQSVWWRREGPGEARTEGRAGSPQLRGISAPTACLSLTPSHPHLPLPPSTWRISSYNPTHCSRPLAMPRLCATTTPVALWVCSTALEQLLLLHWPIHTHARTCVFPERQGTPVPSWETHFLLLVLLKKSPPSAELWRPWYVCVTFLSIPLAATTLHQFLVTCEVPFSPSFILSLHK